jgi:hypothetical protein
VEDDAQERVEAELNRHRSDSPLRFLHEQNGVAIFRDAVFILRDRRHVKDAAVHIGK